MKNGSKTAVGKNFYAIRGSHVRRFRTDDDAPYNVRRRAEGAQSSAPSLVEDGSGLDFHSHHLTISERKEIHFNIAGGVGRPVTEVGKGAPVIAIGQESCADQPLEQMSPFLGSQLRLKLLFGGADKAGIDPVELGVFAFLYTKFPFVGVKLDAEQGLFEDLQIGFGGGARHPAIACDIGRIDRLGVKHGCHSDEAGKTASYTCVFPANT